MVRRLSVVFFLGTLLFGSWAGSVRAEALGGRMLVAGSAVEMFTPSTGRLEKVADQGSEPAFFPSGERFAYIRAGGCFPIAPEGCYTEYSVFERSLSESDPAAPGRQIFGWRDFFVRAVDVTPGGRLIFSAKRGPGPAADGTTLEIYSSALDGSDLEQLTHNDVFDNDPVVSPDGRHIAFVRRVAGRGQIFSMRIDGSGVERLTHGARRNRLPAWSPDGQRLVFISQPPGRGRYLARELHVVRVDDRSVRRLTHNQVPETAPAYSPDGRSIAFVLSGGVWVMASGGHNPHQLFRAPTISGYEGGLDWAP